MRFWASLVSVAFAAALATGVVGAAGPQGIQLEVEAGFDGYSKIGEWTPFAVTLSNDGPALEGKVWLEAPDESGRKRVFARSVSLPSRSKKRVYLYAYSTGFLRNTEVNFQVGSEIVGSASVVLRPIQPGDYLFGIVSADPSAGNFFTGMKMTSTVGEGRITVAHAPLSQVPPNAQGLKSLDVLIFSDVSTAELEVEQRQALENWVSAGGLLVVAGGAGGQKTVAGLRDILPLRLSGISGTRLLESANGLEELASFRLGTSGPYVASVAGEVSGASILARQDGIPFVVQRDLGRGRVTFLAFDISSPPLNSLLGDGLFWKRVLAIDGSSGPSSGLTRRTGVAAGMQSALSNIPSMDLPSVTLLAIFLLLYIVAIGPVNYLILRRYDKREWAWATIPVLTVVFTAAAYTIGFGAKGGDVILHEITVLRSDYGPSGGRAAEAESYLGLFSPSRRTYQLEARGEMLLSKPQAFGSSGVASEVEIVQGDPSTARDINVNAWAMQSFMAEGTVGLGGGVQSELRHEGGRIKGRLINSMSAALDDVVLLNGGRLARIGTLQPGESREIDVALETSVQVWRPGMGGLVVGDPQQPVGGGNDRDKLRKQMIVDAAFGYNSKQGLDWSSSGLTLLGWQNQSPLQITLKGERVLRQSTVLFTASLPVSFGRGDVVVPEGFLGKSLIGTSATKMGRGPAGLLLSNGDAIIRFQLPAEVAGLDVRELSFHFKAMSQEVRPGPMPGPVGASNTQSNLQLFDWTQGRWIDQGRVSGGTSSIGRPAAYVSASGAIEARFESPAGYIEISQLDFSVKGGLR